MRWVSRISICGLLGALVGYARTAVVAQDASAAFRVLRTAQSSGTTERLQAISVVDSLTVWASGTGGTYVRTTDGGATWKAAVVPGAETLEFRDIEAFSAATAYLLASGPGDRSRIYKTTDGGAHWVEQFRSGEPRAFYDCFAFWDPDHGLVMSDAVDGVFPVRVTENGGNTWVQVPADRLPAALPGEGAFAASGTCVVTRGPATAFIATGASGVAARLLRTDDRGRTWEVTETPVTHDTTLAGLTSVAWLDAGRGVVAGGNLAVTDRPLDAVARTEDGGATWTLAARPPVPGTVYGIVAVPGPEALLVAVGPGGSAYTTDLARTWTALDATGAWSVGFAHARAGWAVGPRGRITRFALVRP